MTTELIITEPLLKSLAVEINEAGKKRGGGNRWGVFWGLGWRWDTLEDK
jgi:hypothetical protein